MRWHGLIKGLALLWLSGLSSIAAAHYRVGWLPDPPYLSGTAVAPTGEDIVRLRALLPQDARLQFVQWPLARQARGLAEGGLDIALSLASTKVSSAWLSEPVRYAQYVLAIDPLQLERYQAVASVADVARQGMLLGTLQDSRLHQQADSLLDGVVLIHSLRDLDQLIRLLWLGRLNGLVLDRALLTQEPRLTPLLHLIALPPVPVRWAFSKHAFNAAQMEAINQKVSALRQKAAASPEGPDAGV